MTRPSPAERGAALLAAAFFAAWPLYAGRENRGEDYVYLHSGARLYWSGGEPYDRNAFQLEIARNLLQPNPYQSYKYASAYPPAAFWPAALPASQPYGRGFLLWTAVLFACGLWMARSVRRLAGARGAAGAAAAAAAAALWPGAFHSFVFHRLAVLAAACFLGGLVALEEDDPVLGGFLLGACAVWPPAFALVVLALAARGAWTALAASWWLALAQLLPYLAGSRPWGDWPALLASLRAHAGSAFLDDQSLVMGVYKLFLLPGAWTQAVVDAPAWLAWVRLEFFVFAAAACALFARRFSSHAKAAAFAAALAPLGAVYSHSGDHIWLLPGAALWIGARAARPALALAAVALISRLVMPPYDAPSPARWFTTGYWTLAALAFAAFAALGARARR